MLEVDSIIKGHAVNIMRQMPDNWVNCIITSPPYWGLRDYGIEPLIWDGDPECEHTFDSDNAYHDNLRYRVGHNTTVGNNVNPEIYTIKKTGGLNGKLGENNPAHFESSSQFCSICIAWRGSLGLEPSMEMYINHLCSIFDEAKRVLKDDGSLWVNIGDTYASNGSQETRFWHGSNQGKHQLGNGDGLLSKEYSGRCRTNEVPSKSLCMIPFRFAIEMGNRGWILRNDLIWHKPNCMPSSAKDRFTVDFEHVFFFTKSKRYYFKQQFEPFKIDSVKRMRRGQNEGKWHTEEAPKGFYQRLHEPRDFQGYDGINREYNMHKGRNKRAIWSITTKGFPEAHFATFPETLVEPMIKAGCPEGGIVYDPFMGAGTVAVVAKRLNRHFVGSELKADYVEMAKRRIAKEIPQMEFRLAGG